MLKTNPFIPRRLKIEEVSLLVMQKERKLRVKEIVFKNLHAKPLI